MSGFTAGRRFAAATSRRLFAVALLLMQGVMAQDQPWPQYGGAPGGGGHTLLRRITAANLDRLEVAWTFRTGETGPGDRVHPRMSFEATPIVVGDLMVASTAYGKVFGLDARNGHPRWRFDDGISADTHCAEAATAASRPGPMRRHLQPSAACGSSSARWTPG